jgi:hypothetical protein
MNFFGFGFWAGGAGEGLIGRVAGLVGFLKRSSGAVFARVDAAKGWETSAVGGAAGLVLLGNGRRESRGMADARGRGWAD